MKDLLRPRHYLEPDQFWFVLIFIKYLISFPVPMRRVDEDEDTWLTFRVMLHVLGYVCDAPLHTCTKGINDLFLSVFSDMYFPSGKIFNVCPLPALPLHSLAHTHQLTPHCSFTLQIHFHCGLTLITFPLVLPSYILSTKSSPFLFCPLSKASLSSTFFIVSSFY